MLDSTAFLILSCDNYAELWNAHFDCLDRYWPDCPFDTFILTNFKDSGRPDKQAMKIGSDRSWSDNLKQALQLLRHDYHYVLVTFDDLFLSGPVDTGSLSMIMNQFQQLEGQFIQLIQWHNRPAKVNDKIGLIKPGSLYRPNCVYALWEIGILDQLLVPGESAWDFERKGATRSDRFERFYTVYETIFHYRNTVIRGKIIPKDAETYRLTQSKNLKVMTRGDWFRFRFRYWSFRAFLLLVPRKLQVRVAGIRRK